MSSRGFMKSSHWIINYHDLVPPPARCAVSNFKSRLEVLGGIYMSLTDI